MFWHSEHHLQGACNAKFKTNCQKTSCLFMVPELAGSKMNLKEETTLEGLEWNHLAQDTSKWLPPVNAVTNFGFHNMHGIS
jgi:hypothetical protein